MIPHDIAHVIDLGWSVYPRAPKHRAAAFDGAAEQATCDRAKVATWARELPGCGWYLVLGPSGLWALDVDGPRGADGIGGIARLRELTELHGALPARPTIRTGGGGYAMVFAFNGEPISGRSGTPAAGIDPRRGRQTITLPPSLHHRTGQPYRWLTRPCPPPDAPGWLLRLVEPPPPPPSPAFERTPTPERAIRALTRAVGSLSEAGEGGRNDALNRAAYRVGTYVAGGLIGEGWARAELETAASGIGLKAHEIRATIRSAFRAAQRQPAA